MSRFAAIPNPPPALVALDRALSGPLAHAATTRDEQPWAPPEFHPFGTTRSGAVMGVVVPAPEVASPTWYIAELRDAGVADGLFPSCRAGALAFAQHWGADMSVISALSAAPEHRVGPPAQYLVQDGSDGLPLWVPSRSWRASDVGSLVHPDQIVARLTELLGEGRPGSALHLGRYMSHALSRFPDQAELAEQVWGVLAEVYDALRRPSYAALAAERGPLEQPGIATRETGTLPQHVLALLTELVRGDVHGLTGIRSARVHASGATVTEGPMELAVHIDVALDITQRPDGADLAHVRLVQAWTGGSAVGPILAEVRTVGRRIEPGTPRPTDPTLLPAFERGYVVISGEMPLAPRHGDLSGLAVWLDA